MSLEIKKVISNNLCIGCGVCSIYGTKLKLNAEKLETPTLKSLENLSYKNQHKANYVCPFTSSGPNENQINKKYYSNTKNFNKLTGYYDEIYVGHVTKTKMRMNSSSGGLSTWLAQKLFVLGEIDGVIHIKKKNQKFCFTISNNLKSIKEGAKTRYYSASYSEVIKKLQKLKLKKLIIFGVPCYIKALRRLENQDQNRVSNIKYYFGILCGHMKTSGYLKMLKLQMIKSKKFNDFDFRKKINNGDAHNYGVQIKYDNFKKKKTSLAAELFGSNWSDGLFKANSCNVCDDVSAETADVVFGDAWFPPFDKDWRGNNVIISRSPKITNIINLGKKNNEINLKKISDQDFIKSQWGGFVDRKERIRNRMIIKILSGEWVPKKRMSANYLIIFKYYVLRFLRKLKLINNLEKKLSEDIHEFNYTIYKFKLSEYSRSLINENYNNFKNKIKLFKKENSNKNFLKDFLP